MKLRNKATAKKPKSADPELFTLKIQNFENKNKATKPVTALRPPGPEL
jgi:uridine kinase